jgi:hypothetical protein
LLSDEGGNAGKPPKAGTSRSISVPCLLLVSRVVVLRAVAVAPVPCVARAFRLARNLGRCFRFRLDAESEQQRVLVREAHRMRLPGVALYLHDEPVLVRGASLEPAVAMKHLVHDFSQRR